MGELRERVAADDLPARGLLASILLLAFAIRTGVAFFAGFEWFTPDSYHYLRMADAILAGEPISGFPNGYPLLIAAVKALFPESAVPGALMALNVLLSTAVVGLTYAIARQIGGRSAPALLAAAGVALYPNQLVYLHYLLSEGTTAFLLAAGMLAVCRRRFVGGGALCALATAFRSTLAPVGPLVLLLLLWRPDARRAALGFAAGAVAVGALYGALVAAGAIEPSNNARNNWLLAVGSTSTRFEFSIERYGPEQRRAPLRTYLRFAQSHPGEFLVQRASALWELWGPYPTDQPRPLWERALLGLRFPLLLLACAAIARHPERFGVRALAVPIAVVTAVHVAFFAAPRFTYVVEPLAIALAALAVADRVLGSRRAGERAGLSSVRAAE